MTMDGDMKCAQNLSHEVCGVIIKLWNKDARAVQCMYATRPLECRCNVSTSSLVYLLCMVSCLLLCASFQFFLIVML